MKKIKSHVAILAALTISLSSAISVSADHWYHPYIEELHGGNEDIVGTYWVDEDGEIIYVSLGVRAVSAEELFFPNLAIEILESGEKIIDYDNSLCYGSLEAYKEYLSVKGYDFTEEEILVLFDDYRTRWVDWCYNVGWDKFHYKEATLQIVTDKSIELNPLEFNCPVQIEYRKGHYVNDDKELIEDIRKYYVRFSSFEDLYAVQEMLVNNPDIIKIEKDYEYFRYDSNWSLSEFVDNLRIYGHICEYVNLDALNKVAYSYDISDYSYKSTDVVMLAKYISGKFSYDDETARAAADLSGDSALNSEDLLLMIKKLTGEI